jgi:diguanylate cyclase (GGDEF)-like protein
MCKAKSNEFIRLTNWENLKRLRPLLIVITSILISQIILYTFGTNNSFKNLIIVKVVIVVSIGLILLIINSLHYHEEFFQKYSEVLLQAITIWLLLLAVLSTFYAQEITSDITIYIMVLFVITASVRMTSLRIVMNLAIAYFVFVVGMPFFQADPVFLKSHIINGFIINLLAFVIGKIFYEYSLNDYKDKLQIESHLNALKNISERDALTGLYNIRTINEILDNYVKEQVEDKNHLFLGMLDLDNFKEVNDQYGHAYGDEVLKTVANKILENIRDTDVAGRFGGDEFIIVFRNKDSQQIEKIMSRLLDDITQIDFKEHKISFSCGVAVWEGETRQDLFERADQYMYEVKRSGKNKIKFEANKSKFEDNMDF